MARWEIFPRRAWPRYFGRRELPARGLGADVDQLELQWDFLVTPRDRTATENLRVILVRSHLAQHEFAQWVLGCADHTLTRYLGGARISECRRVFLQRLESVTLHGDRIIITVRCGAVRPLRRWLGQHKNVAPAPLRR